MALLEKLQQILNEKNTKITPENIKAGVTAFGVTGTLDEGVDTSDATATENDLVENKTAYVNGEKITGNIHEIDSYGRTGDSCIDNSYMNELYITKDGSGLSSNVILRPDTGITMGIERSKAATAIGLSADKLKKDETILGVTGTYEGIDTSDANAVALNIEKDKTAYVNGQKITGELDYLDGIPINAELIDINESNSSINVYARVELETDKVIINFDQEIDVPVSYADVAQAIELDSDDIKYGATILGIAGTFDGVDTSDATATAEDIVRNKTAYVNGVKIVGTNEGVTPTGTKSITENGTFDITSFASVDVNVPTTGVMTQEEYDEAVATLDDLLYGNYQEVYSVMNGITDTPTDEYNGVGGTPTQIENTIDTLLGINN